jgi:hypothetical protein
MAKERQQEQKKRAQYVNISNQTITLIQSCLWGALEFSTFLKFYKEDFWIKYPKALYTFCHRITKPSYFGDKYTHKFPLSDFWKVTHYPEHHHIYKLHSISYRLVCGLHFKRDRKCLLWHLLGMINGSHIILNRLFKGPFPFITILIFSKHIMFCGHSCL